MGQVVMQLDPERSVSRLLHMFTVTSKLVTEKKRETGKEDPSWMSSQQEQNKGAR